jgi:hypothetical protein
MMINHNDEYTYLGRFPIIAVIALMIPFFFFTDFPSHFPTDGADAKDHYGEKMPVKGCIFTYFYVLGFPVTYNDLQKYLQ